MTVTMLSILLALFNPHSTSLRIVLLLSLYYRCRKCSLERLISLLKVTTVGKLYIWDTNPGSVALPIVLTNAVFSLNTLHNLGYDEITFRKPF